MHELNKELNTTASTLPSEIAAEAERIEKDPRKQYKYWTAGEKKAWPKVEIKPAKYANEFYKARAAVRLNRWIKTNGKRTPPTHISVNAAQ